MKKRKISVLLLIIITVVITTSAIVLAQSVFRKNQAVTSSLRLSAQNVIQQNTTSQQISSNVDYKNPSENARPLYDDKTDLEYLTVSDLEVFKNLQIGLLYGKADLDEKKYRTLSDALKNKLVVLNETGSVNELNIDNNSAEYIYINSGDIVRGGKQDRTIQYDVILPPKQKNTNLASFCVEHGRWTNRGNENVQAFETSSKALSSKELKIASKYKKDQSEVWNKVNKYQDKANTSINRTKGANEKVEVKSSVSASSLELTLDNAEIKKLNAEYKKYFLSKLNKTSNALGFAYFINGKLYSIDVYNNHQLFSDLFDKLLDAAIAEAISEEKEKPAASKPSKEEVIYFLKANAKVYAEEKVNAVTQFNTSEHNQKKNIVIFTTLDKEEKNWLHRNWLDKTEEE